MDFIPEDMTHMPMYWDVSGARRRVLCFAVLHLWHSHLCCCASIPLPKIIACTLHVEGIKDTTRYKRIRLSAVSRRIVQSTTACKKQC